jgi:hypothetical protein
LRIDFADGRFSSQLGWTISGANLVLFARYGGYRECPADLVVSAAS